MRWFTTGIISLAVLLGFLVGASHTPVAGVAITATFGLLAAVFALHQKATIGKALTLKQSLLKQLEQLKPKITDALNALGRTLFIFAVSFSVGLACGIYLRVGEPFSSSRALATFPWEGETEPVSSQLAIDWILVQEKLRIMGYRDQQIRALYAQDMKSRKERGRYMGRRDLLSPLLSEVQPIYRSMQGNDDRIVAEDPELSKKIWGGNS